MSLHVERAGHGPALVLLHGWGLHGGIWKDLAAALADRFTLITVDLPGHGHSRATAMPEQLAAVTDLIAEGVDETAAWLGWSLGGLVALDVANRYPHKVTRLVLVDSTPRFVQNADWQPAMPPDVFNQFAVSLENDYRATVLRFLSLQAGNDDEGRRLIKTLRGEIFARGEPDPQSLAHGLALLAHSDLRQAVSGIATPVLVIQGQHDRLVPPAAGVWLAATLPQARLETIDSAGHAPFLSHPQRFLNTLRGFLQ
jgi:pimeloyl-[acyl-carrier protein] methyl ester esterase